MSKADIEMALKRSAESEGRNIKVAVDGTRVTLTGDLDSYSEIEDARMAAWNAAVSQRFRINCISSTKLLCFSGYSFL